MKKMMRSLIAASLFIGASGLGAFSQEVSAKQYEYDDLNRLTAVESEKGRTTYTYDAGGNLLSAVHTPTENASFRATTNIASGWTSYATSGVDAEFALVTEAVYQEQTQSGSAAEDGNSSVAQDVYSVTESVYQPQSEMTVQKISASSNRAGGVNMYRDLEISGGQTYSTKGLIKAPLIEQSVVKVVINYYDAKGKLITHHNAVILPQASGWESFYSETTSPRNAVKARVHLQITILQKSGSGEAGFANVSFQSKRNDG
ncbi:RHS repeat domain-containing protein [Paenibacillus zeirhizosphaerae]|uniref:RHS repeat domain-containing protein n=1 Tax=Paenibacillus zeirhizosphaerae TaxID=2987519 RepID=UPI003F97090C